MNSRLMERNTVIGKSKLSFVFRPLSFVRNGTLAGSYKTLRTKNKGQRTTSAGFTLLELMIVLFIIVILAIVILPQFQKSVLKAKEAVLKDNLHTMRRMLDQYAADKGKLPQSIDELVEAGYLREKPTDPMTETNEWEEILGTDPNSLEDAQGVVDVKSKSTDTGSDGKAYNEW